MKRYIAISFLLVPALLLMLAAWFGAGMEDLSSGYAREGRQQLENTLRRSAVACYAAEGIYPPDIGYLVEHYGVQINEEKYTVYYEIFADNIMPQITVLEK